MFYPPPPPRNRDKPKKFQNVRSALRASTLTALGLLTALAMLLPNAAAEAQSSPATATSTATATATATPTDYDSDDDGLIDINNLAQLNAVRYDLNGDGKQGTVSATDWATYTAAFPNPAAGMGCKPTDHDDDATTDTQPTCKGYELMRDLDFDTDGDGDVDSSDTNSYANWTPIGTAARPFDSKFEGSLTNGVMPKISNLTISGGATEAGLFGATGENAHIKNIGLVDVKVDTTTSTRNAKISALVGNNAGRITACYVTGKISAGAGAYPDAGGLVGYNGGTIAASFSRATVYMSSSSEIYVGGLVGYNGGTITATYSAGAVKGKGGSGVVGGLVGYNVGTINASYSIAPVTSIDTDPTNIRTSKPAVLGLSYNESGYSTVTASYWDHVSSGILSDTVPSEEKSAHDLMSPTGYTGIYADWDDLTIDGANDVAPWDFSRADQHPQLKYGGHTIALAGNQRFASIKIGGQIVWSINSSRNVMHPTEGMTIIAGDTSVDWIWESSVDGIDWTALSPLPGEESQALRSSVPAYQFVPRPEHEGKYIRAKMPTGDHLVSRAIGKIMLTSASDFVLAGPQNPPHRGFVSGHNPPRVGTPITAASHPSALSSATTPGATTAALWYRCDANDANPPSSGCELVGSRLSYTPGSADFGHYLYAYIYHYRMVKTYGATVGDSRTERYPGYHPSPGWRYSFTGPTPKRVVDQDRASQWRRAGE